MGTSEVLELDVGLRTVREKLSAFRIDVDGLRVEFDSKLEVVVDERLLRPSFKIGRH